MAGAIVSYDDFAAHVGTAFLLTDGDQPPVPLGLTAATPLRPHAEASAMRAPFELLFLAAEQRVLPQSLYHLHHDAMGDLEIFLVPTARDDTGVTYSATFN